MYHWAVPFGPRLLARDLRLGGPGAKPTECEEYPSRAYGKTLRWVSADAVIPAAASLEDLGNGSSERNRPPLPKAMPMARKLAYRNLFHDRLSLFVTLVGIVFSVVLIAVQCSIYLGSEFRIVAVMDHIEADLWVIPVGTKSFDLPTCCCPGARSTPLCRRPACRALKISSSASSTGAGWARATDKPGCATETGICGPASALLVGSDTGANKSLPWDVIEGTLADLSMPNAVAVDSIYFKELAVNGIGDRAEINDTQVTVKVVTRGIRSFTTLPFIFTRSRWRER